MSGMERTCAPIRVKPFAPDDALTMLVQDSQRLEWHDRQAVAQRFADAGNAFTILSSDGRPIFCGGAMEMHPGHAQLWALFAKDKGGDMLRVLRATRMFIASLPHRRVDTPVLDRPEAKRWAEMLGLRHDVTLAEAAHDGGDVLIYRKVN